MDGSLRLTRPEIAGWYGVASSSHWLASATAMRLLERGGNAFDAAVAAGFVLQVATPHLNGPAGDLALLCHEAASGDTQALCGQGPTPAAATIERFRALGLDLIPGTGLLPAVVPGAYDAWLALLAEKGTVTLREVLEPAIGYALRGVPVDERLHATLQASAGMFARHWPDSQAVFLPGGAVPAVGGLLANPVLAGTWGRLLEQAEAAGGDRLRQIEAARAAWSDGFVAEAIDRFCGRTVAMDVSGAAHGALLTGDDLAGWRAVFEAPVTQAYGVHVVAKCGPWTQGPALLQALDLLPPDEMAALDPLGGAFVHRVAEALKLALADRELYADPAQVEVPLGRLLSRDYAAARRAAIGESADNRWRPGDLAGVAWRADYAAACARKREDGLLGAYGGGEPTVQDLGRLTSVVGDTCHLDVVDAAGNMVSATPSGGWLQSSPAIPELGFPLGTRAQVMWLDPEAPGALAPGRRPRSTLTPTLVLDGEGAGYLACGTPGGDQQEQWQAAFLIRHLVHGMGLQEAIEAPAFHSEHAPNSFYPRHASPGRLVVEGRFAPAVQDELRARGHDLVVGDDWSEGRLTAAARDASGLLRAGANPRGGLGYAVGR